MCACRMSSARPGGPVPAAATDAANLTSQWMGKVVSKLVEQYGHAPWQVCVMIDDAHAVMFVCMVRKRASN